MGAPVRLSFTSASRNTTRVLMRIVSATSCARRRMRTDDDKRNQRREDYEQTHGRFIDSNLKLISEFMSRSCLLVRDLQWWHRR